MFSRIEMLNLRNRMKNSSYIEDEIFFTFVREGSIGLFFLRTESESDEKKDNLIDHEWNEVEFAYGNDFYIFEKDEFEPYWNLFTNGGYKITKLDPNKKGTYIIVSLE